MNDGKGTGLRHRRRAEADQQVRDYLASGLAQNRWCQERGIRPASLRYWVKRRQRDAESYSLVPVEIGGRPANGGVLDLRIGGIQLRVGAGSDPRALAALLRELA